MRDRAWIAAVLCAASLAGAATFSEDFSTNPFADGWKIFGDTNLFQWDSSNECLQVTWDSSQTNSYFCQPIGTVLTKSDDFSLSFTLQLADIAVGLSSDQPFTFELAVGFINLAAASGTNFERGVVAANLGARNLCEFDYFPDSGYGATISPTMISTNSQYNQFATVFAFPFELDPGALFHVAMTYSASNRTLHTTMTRAGEDFGPIPNVVLGTNFLDFRLDSVAVCNYSDTGADGSLLAHGVVDNLVVTVPPPPILNLAGTMTNRFWQMQFQSRTNWIYTLERTADLKSWIDVSPAICCTTAALRLQDTNPPANCAYYRVRAERP